jgi:GSH-dependent disulfide-bond oxidoreductase
VDAREPVKRGRCVNAAGGPEDEHLHERHSAADIDKVLAVRKARGTV